LKEIKIGSQIWSAENLDTGFFRNGDKIHEASTFREWVQAGNNKQPAYCFPRNEYNSGYGRLYNSYALLDPRGLEYDDTKWRLPYTDDWKRLENFLGEKLAGLRLKANNSWSGHSCSTDISCPNCKGWVQEYRNKVPCHRCFDKRIISIDCNDNSLNGNEDFYTASGFNAYPIGKRIYLPEKFFGSLAEGLNYQTYEREGLEAAWWALDNDIIEKSTFTGMIKNKIGINPCRKINIEIFNSTINISDLFSGDKKNGYSVRLIQYYY